MRLTRVGCAAFAIAILMNIQAFAQTVSVAAFEEPYADASDIDGFVNDIASSCMDELFAQGFVATSERPGFLKPAAFDATKDSLKLEDAQAGRVDYIIAFESASYFSKYRKSLRLPGNIRYKLVQVSDGKTIFSGKLKAMKDSEDAETELPQWIKAESADLTRACIKKLSGK
jgi:hypothetical protein